jgi:hypothetical protein
MLSGATSGQVTLDHEDIERVAARVVQLLHGEIPDRAVRLVDAAAVAEMLGVDRDWVYAHARDPGAIRLGGPRGRVRFDVRKVEGALARAEPSPKTSRPARRGIPGRGGESADLLPYEK